MKITSNNNELNQMIKKLQEGGEMAPPPEAAPEAGAPEAGAPEGGDPTA